MLKYFRKFYFNNLKNMETKNISQRFSLIYGIVNFIFWLYIIFMIAFVLLFPIISFSWNISISELFLKIFQELQKQEIFILAISLLFIWLSVFILNVYLLYLLRKISFSLKNWEIFTFENRKNIKKMFVILAILFIVSWIIFSWWIISIVAWLFIWILYEIFFIGFDYKLKNEKLEEENNLTI